MAGAHRILVLGLALMFGGPALAAAPGPAVQSSSKSRIEAAREELREASPDTPGLLAWVLASRDNLGLPFIIVDKVHARAAAFAADGSLRGSAPVLIGLGRGDVSPPGIGQRRLADIPPRDRITPAGRFIASLGNDLGAADVLWVDYEAAISLHRLIAGKRKDNRALRLATHTAADNRITYGCINVPTDFFDTIVRPMFSGTNGLVYILPDTRPLNEVFAFSRE